MLVSWNDWATSLGRDDLQPLDLQLTGHATHCSALATVSAERAINEHSRSATLHATTGGLLEHVGFCVRPADWVDLQSHWLAVGADAVERPPADIQACERPLSFRHPEVFAELCQVLQPIWIRVRG